MQSSPSSSANSLPLSNLDTLLLEYLDTLDTYQSAVSSVSARMSAGFLALAQANFHSRGGVRYGQDLYDARMRALRGVAITPARGNGKGEEVVFEERRFEAGESVEVGEEEKARGDGEGVRRRRRGKGRQEQDGDEEPGDEKKERDEPTQEQELKGEEEEPKRTPPDRRDPLRWFGILVPPALRAAQSEFTRSLPHLLAIATTLSTLSALSARITHHRRAKHLYKILPPSSFPSPPGTPPPSASPEAEIEGTKTGENGEKEKKQDTERIPPLPLDESSGFLHLCVASQVVGVVTRFMSDCERVCVLRLDYDRIAADVRWEPVQLEEGEEDFPHLYAREGEDLGIDAGAVDKRTVMERGEGGWEDVLRDGGFE